MQKELYLVFNKNFDGKVFTKQAYNNYVAKLSLSEFISLEAQEINIEQALAYTNGNFQNIITLEDLENS